MDLNCVVERLTEICGWDRKAAEKVKLQYQRFLIIKMMYPNLPLPPSREIDEFWHNHILYTRKYHADCLKMFGRYLHHEPHHGEMNEINENKLNKMFDITQRVYFEAFGEYIYKVNYKPLINYRRIYEKFFKYFTTKKIS